MKGIFFHYVFTFSFLAFVVIRVVYRRMAQKTEGKVAYKEGQLNQAARGLVGGLFILLLFAYMVYPALLEWAAFELPDWASWAGAVLMVGSVLLVWWVQWALGSNFATTLHVREEHTLVTHGPYRWVRHPMYTTFYLMMLGMLLVTANWFIGVVPLVGLTGVVLTRTRNEEAAMIEKFGTAYQAYMGRTGRFLPKIRAS